MTPATIRRILRLHFRRTGCFYSFFKYDNRWWYGFRIEPWAKLKGLDPGKPKYYKGKHAWRDKFDGRSWDHEEPSSTETPEGITQLACEHALEYFRTYWEKK